SGVINSLIDGFHAAYRVPRDRSFPRQAGVTMLLVLACAFPLLCGCALILFGGLLERAIVDWLNADPLLVYVSSGWRWVSRGTRYILSFGISSGVAAILYYFGPYRVQRWRFVWPG